ncbi:hypothetical protein SAMN04488490_1830 [Marinobacter sp. LV10R510-11A]|nr:hypothetical protein SAMN04488490_1830 [Marinobacter sp. LV10R510-11A]
MISIKPLPPSSDTELTGGGYLYRGLHRACKAVGVREGFAPITKVTWQVSPGLRVR